MNVVKKLLIIRRQIARLKINAALSTAAATAPLRLIDVTDPATWEFTGFSQNGEDGVIDFLTRRILSPTRHFLGIGSSDGMENNTSWLAFARRYSGLMVEGDRRKAKLSEMTGLGLRPGVSCLNLFVDLHNLDVIRSRNAVENLHVLSVDIDGIDYHVVNRILETGLRQAILVVEYNATFGPDMVVTVPYDAAFQHRDVHPSFLYFGASVGSWRFLCEQHGLKFVTVEQNGVNAFAVDPTRFPQSFLDELSGVDFRENYYQRHAFRVGWKERFELIKELDLQTVG